MKKVLTCALLGLVIAGVAFELVLFAIYFNTPVGELPTWVAWLLAK